MTEYRVDDTAADGSAGLLRIPNVKDGCNPSCLHWDRLRFSWRLTTRHKIDRRWWANGESPMRRNKGSCTADLLPRNRKKKCWQGEKMAEQDEEGEFSAESPAAREWKCILGGEIVISVYLFIHAQTAGTCVRACVSMLTCLQWMAHCLWLRKYLAWSISTPLLQARQLDQSLVVLMLLCSLTLFPLHPATLPSPDKAPQMPDFSLIFPNEWRWRAEKREARTPPAVEESWSTVTVCVCFGCESSFSWKPHCGQDIRHGLDAASVPPLRSLAVRPASFSPRQDLQLLRWWVFFFCM